MSISLNNGITHASSIVVIPSQIIKSINFSHTISTYYQSLVVKYLIQQFSNTTLLQQIISDPILLLWSLIEQQIVSDPILLLWCLIEQQIVSDPILLLWSLIEPQIVSDTILLLWSLIEHQIFFIFTKPAWCSGQRFFLMGFYFRVRVPALEVIYG